MTIHTPKDVLVAAFRPKLAPPRRWTEDDTLLLDIRDKIARAQNINSLRGPLRSLLGDVLVEMGLEDAARTGLIGVLSSECEFAKSE